MLGILYLNGEGVNKDIDKALELIIHSAEGHCVLAQLYLGKFYFQKNDYISSSKWYINASLLGNVIAYKNLAYMYYHGYVCNINTNSLFGKTSLKEEEFSIRINKGFNRYIINAAENNDVDAQYLLGSLYKHGNIIDKNAMFAIFWLTKAADNGHTKAWTELSDNYRPMKTRRI